MSSKIDVEPILLEEFQRQLDNDKGSLVTAPYLSRCVKTESDHPSEWVGIMDAVRAKKFSQLFKDALKKFKEMRSSESRKKFSNGDAWKAGLIYAINKRGEAVIESIATNVKMILTHDHAWKGVLAFDEFQNKIVIRGIPPIDMQGRKKWEEEDAHLVRVWLETEYGMRPTAALVFEMIATVAKANRFSSVVDYLDKLPRDFDQGNLDTWLIDAFDCEDTPYNRAVGRMILIAGVARARDPGCQVDYALILEGAQGLRKSTVLKSLCPNSEWFIDGLSEFGSKAQSEEVEGKWIAELAELDNLNRSEVNSTKAFITRKAEHYRPAYARYGIVSPRKFILFGTVNPGHNGYLKDPTGNRRFWPVTCRAKAKTLTPEMRDRLWAEADAAYQAGEPWWFENEELEKLATIEQEKRVERDPWHEDVAEFVAGKQETNMEDILSVCIKLDIAKREHYHNTRVGRVLSALKWQKKERQVRGRKTYYYVSPVYLDSHLSTSQSPPQDLR